MSRFSSLCARLLGRLLGWQIQGEFPSAPFVLVAAPHTSNADFFAGLYVTRARRIKPRFLAKSSLFRGPLGVWMRALGGVPVSRGAPGGLVATAAALLREGAVIAVLPKGRRRPGHWKSGFLQMSRASGAPMVPVGFDYRTRTVFVFPAVEAHLDTAEVMARMQLCLSQIQGRRPEWNDQIELGESGGRPG